MRTLQFGSTWLKRLALATALGGVAFTLAAPPAFADPYDRDHRRWERHHRHYYRDYRPVYPPVVHYYNPPPRVYYAPPPPVYYPPPGLSLTIPLR